MTASRSRGSSFTDGVVMLDPVTSSATGAHTRGRGQRPLWERCRLAEMALHCSTSCYGQGPGGPLRGAGAVRAGIAAESGRARYPPWGARQVPLRAYARSQSDVSTRRVAPSAPDEASKCFCSSTHGAHGWGPSLPVRRGDVDQQRAAFRRRMRRVDPVLDLRETDGRRRRGQAAALDAVPVGQGGLGVRQEFEEGELERIGLRQCRRRRLRLDDRAWAPGEPEGRAELQRRATARRPSASRGHREPVARRVRADGGPDGG